jgi:hypothetical protein
MTSRTFTITLADTDRCMILTALGFAATYLIAHSAPVDQQKPINELIQRLSGAPGQDSPVNHAPTKEFSPTGGVAAAAAVLAPPAPQPKDYFAADRDGNIPMTPPKGAELKTVRILQADEKPGKNGQFLAVIFTGGKGSCFDKGLWNGIKNRANKDSELGLWISKSADGKYQNIVGVRA